MTNEKGGKVGVISYHFFPVGYSSADSVDVGVPLDFQDECFLLA
jgi:hypothetical protein